MPQSRQQKEAYMAKIVDLFHTYKKVIVANIDSVGSIQLHQIRHELRGRAVCIKCKNSLVRYVTHHQLHDMHVLEELQPHLGGNHCFFFTNENPKDIVEIITANRREAVAKTGQIAPCDVTIPAMITNLDPSQSSFFISLNVPTKLNRGHVEIIRDIDLIKKGDKVTSAQVALLAKLDIKPFFYAVNIEYVIDDGVLYPASMLSVTDEDYIKTVKDAVHKLTAVSLAADYPTVMAVPHLFSGAFMKVLALGVATKYDAPELHEIEEFLEDPSKFQTAAAAPAAAAAEAAPAAAVAAAPEPEEESSESFGFGGLF